MTTQNTWAWHNTLGHDTTHSGMTQHSGNAQNTRAMTTHLGMAQHTRAWHIGVNWLLRVSWLVQGLTLVKKASLCYIKCIHCITVEWFDW